MGATVANRIMRFIEEVTPGTTPPTPTMETFRRAGGAGLVRNRDSFLSDEELGHPGVVDLRLGAKKPEIALPFELSFGTFDAFLASALGSSWVTNELRCGSDIKTMTIEDGHPDPDVGVFLPATGMVVNAMNLSIPANGIIKGTFNMLGMSFGDVGSATIASTTNPATTTPVMDSYTGSIQRDSSPIAIITSAELSITGNRIPKFALMADEAHHLSVGKLAVKLNLSVFLEDSSFIDAFDNEIPSEIVIAPQDSLGNQYLFTFPSMKLSAETRDPQEGDIIQKLTGEALWDPTDTSLVITRVPA